MLQTLVRCHLLHVINYASGSVSPLDFDTGEWNCVFCEGSGCVVVLSLYNLHLQSVSVKLLADLNLWKWNVVFSTRLLCMCARSQHGGVFPACFAYDCRLSGSKGGSHEAGDGRPRLMLLLSGDLGEVLLYNVHNVHLHFRRLADALVQGSSLVAQVGVSYHSKTRWQKSKELTDSCWFQPVTCSCLHSNITK